jgi:hypothetical protein
VFILISYSLKCSLNFSFLCLITHYLYYTHTHFFSHTHTNTRLALLYNIMVRDCGNSFVLLLSRYRGRNASSCEYSSQRSRDWRQQFSTDDVVDIQTLNKRKRRSIFCVCVDVFSHFTFLLHSFCSRTIFLLFFSQQSSSF